MYTHMDRTIFHLEASVPATSLYILITSILDEGNSPTLERVRELWNGTEEELKQAFNELNRRGVLHPVERSSNGKPAWIDLTSNWRKIVRPGIF